MGVHIFWDSRVQVGLARPVTEELSTVLDAPISRIDNCIFPLEGYDSLRGQYDAVKILKKLDMFRQRRPDIFKPQDMDDSFYRNYNHIYEKVLLVTDGDIFAPQTTFVYGLAHIKLGVSVISTYRLKNEFYGRHSDDNALIDRMVTEGAHEIGHLYGLEHCSNPGCIMYCPTNLDDLIRKRKYFCGKCRLTLSSRIGQGFEL